MTDDFSEDEKRGFYKAIYSRRDVRSHFTSEPIKDDILSKILHAAHHAPSVGFSQPWNFILIKDIKTKKKINFFHWFFHRKTISCITFVFFLLFF